MLERIHQELVALPALQQLTLPQLHELSWKTKERVLIALFEEHASSNAVATVLLSRAKLRKLERSAEQIEWSVEKLDSADRAANRKREDTFRADFMKVAVKELARLGAPTTISWQKLVFDKDWCVHAFQVLLTRIKSARRIAQRSLSAGAAPSSQRDESEKLTTDDFRPEDDSQRQRPGLKAKLRSTVRKSTTPEGDEADGWNYDISVSSSERERGNNNTELARDSGGFELPVLAPPGSSTVVERRASSATKQQAVSQAASERKGQLQGLQRVNAALADENARLKEELAVLEAENALLRTDRNDAEPAHSFDLRRMRLVQAQNLQLQRQISLLQDSVADMQHVESSLLAVLTRWRSVVDAGVQEAKAAGAAQAGQSEGGKEIKWMLAVPDALVSELKRAESQICSAGLAVSTALEAKLRVSGASSAYLRSPATALKTADVFAGGGHHPPSSHLRLDRLKLLESKLVRLARLADAFAADALQSRPPRVQINSTSSGGRCDAAALVDATRQVLLELGALGAVVSTATASPAADTGKQLTAALVYKAFASAGAGKEREKALKTMLTQLHACHVSVENDANACRHEAQYWREAWETQAEILRQLVTRVAALGAKKMQWVQAALADPLRQIAQAFEAFQRAQVDGTSRQNPFLPLLVETLESQQSALVDCLSQWRSHFGALETQLMGLVDDYEANASVLAQSRDRKQQR